MYEFIGMTQKNPVAYASGWIEATMVDGAAGMRSLTKKEFPMMGN